MEEKIINLISTYQGIPKEKINGESQLINDLGLSSYDVVDLSCRLEEEFDIEISDKDIKNLVRISDVVKYIENLKQ